MNTIKNALLNAIACIPISWILALLVLGLLAVLALAVIAGLNLIHA